MSRPAVYLIYGIVEDDGTTARADLVETGAMRYKDLVAIVRAVDAEGDSRREDWSPEQVQYWLADHQRTHIALFQRHPLLPLRFGTLVGGQAEVEEFLAASYLQIKAALARVRGKAEFVVQLCWDLPAVLQELCREHQALQSLMEAADPGDRVVLGQLLFEAAERKKSHLVEAVHRQLAHVSLDAAEAKLSDDSMLMNRSYLIERTAEATFDAAMAALGNAQPSYLRMKYVGPLPPYSFVPLVWTRGNATLIDQARQTLGLPTRARFRAIKTAYRQLAVQYHPDRNPHDGDAATRFRQLTEAYELLEAYCVSCGGLADNTVYSFAPDEVHKVFVVREQQGH